jgi:hypothetical protein
MDLASAPVRPGFVLLWIAAVTGSIFAALPLICPRPADTAAETKPAAVPAVVGVRAPAPGPADPAAPVLQIAPFEGGSVFSEAARAGETPQEPKADGEEVSGLEEAPAITASVDLLEGPPQAPALGRVLAPAASSGPLACALPATFTWSLSAASGEEEDEVRLEVRPAGRGLYFLRLLFARFDRLGLEAVPDELLAALPATVKARLAEKVRRSREEAENDSDQTEDSRGRQASRFLRGHRAELLELLDEEELRELRRRLLAARRAAAAQG